MGDGRSSVSPYDTAWVSFIEDSNTNINGTSKTPLFPSCLQWIIDNQLDDGSWGEELVFCIYDRLLNTLACVVALTLWNTCLHKRNKGELKTCTYISSRIYITSYILLPPFQNN